MHLYYVSDSDVPVSSFAMLFHMKPPDYSSCFSLSATGYQKATDCDVPKMSELLFPVMKRQCIPNFASMSFSKIG
jgi:hypothetical protein